MFNPFRKILHRGEPEDLEDIRSHVLGDRFDPSFDSGVVDDQFSASSRPPVNNYSSFDNLTDKTRDTFLPSAPPSNLDQQMHGELYNQERADVNYEILDRLKMIEATLSAIRSQTETINERLKNLEIKMGYRRY